MNKLTNPYTNTKSTISFPRGSEFVKKNFPNTFNFDRKIKKDIIQKGLKSPINSSIIDAGAHIGDGSIPIAHAFKENNRSDLLVYAIEPSKEKCDFITEIAKINQLDNLIVLNYGLSDKSEQLQQDNIYRRQNTGAKTWGNFNNDNQNSEFRTLDSLYLDKIIKYPIKVIHFDLEGHESKSLDGSKYILENFKPYLSLENTKKDRRFFKHLPSSYENRYNLHNNQIFIHKDSL